MVQNVAVEVNTATGQQVIALVTTRKGEGKRGIGIRAAARTGLLSLPNGTTGLYHQYYAGYDKKIGSFDIGGSADYLHDLWPQQKDASIDNVKPYNLDRWRLNAYMIWRPDVHNTIEAHVNYAPQGVDSIQAQHLAATVNTGSIHEKQNLLTPWVRWHGAWLPGLSNDLQAGYLAELHKYDYLKTYETDPINASFSGYNSTNMHQHTDHIYLRDRIGYRMQAGSWAIEPAVNGSYEHVRNRVVQDMAYVYGSSISASEGSQWTNGHVILLTPSLDIQYKDVLDLQGGFMDNVTAYHGGSGQAKPKRVYPFASLGFDVLRIVRPESRPALKIFASYAQRRKLFDCGRKTAGQLQFRAAKLRESR